MELVDDVDDRVVVEEDVEVVDVLVDVEVVVTHDLISHRSPIGHPHLSHLSKSPLLFVQRSGLF